MSPESLCSQLRMDLSRKSGCSTDTRQRVSPLEVFHGKINTHFRYSLQNHFGVWRFILKREYIRYPMLGELEAWVASEECIGISIFGPF